ncbi:hypothetical protein OS493_010114 [Desmophyllum pertusum]|uniref:Uncharacterized protein n=1 Tax=Desmophyllum pertusum TaxID=174260 RepID=A0A9W9YG78_9CNID|nr:hypothetical protein OS493_010114 [Desmophyllum pertusum]
MTLVINLPEVRLNQLIEMQARKTPSHLKRARSSAPRIPDVELKKTDSLLAGSVLVHHWLGSAVPDRGGEGSLPNDCQREQHSARPAMPTVIQRNDGAKLSRQGRNVINSFFYNRLEGSKNVSNIRKLSRWIDQQTARCSM